MPEHLGHAAIYLVCQKNDFLKRPNVIICHSRRSNRN
jgi:hypothetical protein